MSGLDNSCPKPWMYHGVLWEFHGGVAYLNVAPIGVGPHRMGSPPPRSARGDPIFERTEPTSGDVMSRKYPPVAGNRSEKKRCFSKHVGTVCTSIYYILRAPCR